MFKFKNNYSNLYNKIILLTRKKYFYVECNLEDTVSSRIFLALFYLAFILKILKDNKTNKIVSQEIHDYFFNQIEVNLREIGYGDVSINKKMKNLVKLFHEILLHTNIWNNNNKKDIIKYLTKLFEIKKEKAIKADKLFLYMDKFNVKNKNKSLNFFIKGIIDCE